MLPFNVMVASTVIAGSVAMLSSILTGCPDVQYVPSASTVSMLRNSQAKRYNSGPNYHYLSLCLQNVGAFLLGPVTVDTYSIL